MSLKHIFAQPEYVEGIGDVYPIRLKDFDKFQECSGILYISKNNFKNCDDVPLLDLIFVCAEQLGFTPIELISTFEKLFSLVLRKEVKFIEFKSYFDIENKYKIDALNYEKLRSVIMNQNIIIEPKVYKTEIMNKWAQKALIAKQKNAPKITMEDMITTISVESQKHYWDLENYTIYQIYSDFYRIRKIMNHNISVQYKSSQNYDPSSISVEDFAESLDLYHNPYDDLFVDKDKFSKLDNAVK
jgi:hypothetical protein